MKKRRIVLIVIPIMLFIIFAISITAGIMSGFEGWAYHKAVKFMSPEVTSVMKGITHIGDPSIVIVFCLLLIALPKTRRTIALPVSLSVIFSFILNIFLKHVFTRERPDILRLINETSYSFPSGHAMINASLYTMLIILIFKFIKKASLKLTLSVLCMIMIMAIGFSRVYLGVHYAGDIIGGWSIGFAISIIVYFIWEKRTPKEDKLYS